MASFNDDQGGYVIGVILVVIGSLCLVALFVLLYSSPLHIRILLYKNIGRPLMN